MKYDSVEFISPVKTMAEVQVVKLTLWACPMCGAYVMDQTTHNSFHQAHE